MTDRFDITSAVAGALFLCVVCGCASGDTRAGAAAREPSSGVAAVEQSDAIPWKRYLEVLGTKPTARGRMLTFYFTTKDCAPCAMMERWTFSDRRVVKAMEDFVPVMVRGDVELRAARKLAVKTFPTIVFFRQGEGEIDRKTGFRGADLLLEWMREVKENETTIAALSEKLESDPADLDALLGQAENYLDAGRLNEALVLIRSAEKIAPGEVRAMVLSGRYYLTIGNVDKAEAKADAALAASGRDKKARKLKIAILLGKADAALADGDAEGALEPLSEVLLIDPENLDALMDAGRTLLSLDRGSRALDNFRRAAEAHPDSPLPHDALGSYYMEESAEAEAEKEFLKAIETEPRYEAPYFRLIELYEKQGKRDRVMETYERVLRINPAGAHNEIAWLMATSEHADIRDPEAAIKHATIAIELEPHEWYIDTLAEAYYATGHYDAAIAVIKEAIAKDPLDPRYYQDQLKKFTDAKAAAE